MLKQWLPWILLALVVIIGTLFFIKTSNVVPGDNPYIMEKNRIEGELLQKKLYSDSLEKQNKRLKILYIEESKKPKRIINVTQIKIDSVKHLPLDSAASFHFLWTGKQPPTLGVQRDSIHQNR